MPYVTVIYLTYRAAQFKIEYSVMLMQDLKSRSPRHQMLYFQDG